MCVPPLHYSCVCLHYIHLCRALHRSRERSEVCWHPQNAPTAHPLQYTEHPLWGYLKTTGFVATLTYRRQSLWRQLLSLIIANHMQTTNVAHASHSRYHPIIWQLPYEEKPSFRCVRAHVCNAVFHICVKVKRADPRMYHLSSIIYVSTSLCAPN